MRAPTFPTLLDDSVTSPQRLASSSMKWDNHGADDNHRAVMITTVQDASHGMFTQPGPQPPHPPTVTAAAQAQTAGQTGASPCCVVCKTLNQQRAGLALYLA